VRTYGTIDWEPTTADRGRWIIDAEPHVGQRIRRIFTQVEETRTGAVILSDTPATARDLDDMLLSRYPMRFASPEAGTRLEARAEFHRQTEEKITRIVLGGQRLSTVGQLPAMPPRDYQWAPSDLVISTEQGLLCTDDLGLGKTLEAFLLLRAEDALPAVLVCQTHLPQQMLAELTAVWPWLKGHVVTSTTLYDPAEKLAGHPPDVLIIPYSKLHGWAGYLDAAGVRTVIFDEAHELRRAENSDGTLTRKYAAAALLARNAKYTIGMTNTPVFNYGDEIFNIVDVLAPGALGTSGEFRRAWCRSLDNGKWEVVNPTALRTFLIEQGLMMGRTRKDVGRELPPVQEVEHFVDTDLETLVREAGDVGKLAERILAKDTPKRERFTAQGQLEAKLREATGVAKAPYVADFVRMVLESEERVILWGYHHAVYAIWRELLAEFNPVFYTGAETGKHKQEAKEAFVSGRSRLLVMSLRSGAGIEGLQNVCNVGVFGELDWTPAQHHQCIGRLNRDVTTGEQVPVIAYFLVCDHGCDPVMASVLQIKRGQSEPLVGSTNVIKPVKNPADRIRALAESFLAQQARNDKTAKKPSALPRPGQDPAAGPPGRRPRRLHTGHQQPDLFLISTDGDVQ
jgi:hypothetical protein